MELSKDKKVYKDLEKYNIGDIIEAENKKWKIYGINNDTKKLYHCIDNRGFKSSFHAIDINGG